MSLEVSVQHHYSGLDLDVSFQASSDSVTALFGPSGAGKTTVVHAISGLLTPDAGRIALNGATLLDTARAIDVAARKRKISYVFQDARLFPHLSVKRNLLFGWRRSKSRVAAGDIEHIIKLLDIQALLDRSPVTLSMGERQRVAIGRALLASPKLLLLDEPMASLDFRRRNEILPYLERLRDDAAVPMVYVSHAVDEVARLADQVVMLERGRAVSQGPISAVFANLDLFPVVSELEAGAVLTTTIEKHDDGYGLTTLVLNAQQLSVPSIDRPVGTVVRVRVRARAVMIALNRPDEISANNVLAATISDIRTDASAYADIQLVCDGQRIVARITRASRDRLALKIGMAVFAIIKTVTLAGESLRAGG